jgi:hypothetical protein
LNCILTYQVWVYHLPLGYVTKEVYWAAIKTREIQNRFTSFWPIEFKEIHGVHWIVISKYWWRCEQNDRLVCFLAKNCCRG